MGEFATLTKASEILGGGATGNQYLTKKELNNLFSNYNRDTVEIMFTHDDEFVDENYIIKEKINLKVHISVSGNIYGSDKMIVSKDNSVENVYECNRNTSGTNPDFEFYTSMQEELIFYIFIYPGGHAMIIDEDIMANNSSFECEMKLEPNNTMGGYKVTIIPHEGTNYDRETTYTLNIRIEIPN